MPRAFRARAAVCLSASVLTMSLVVLPAVLTTAGCQTEVTTSDGRPLPPDPRPAPPVPSSAKANRMTLLVGPKPDDADGNGYPDLIRVTAALFSFPHPTAMEANGAFVFTLYRYGEAFDPAAVPIGEWRIEGDRLASLRARAMYGPCYRCDLSLLETGTDRLAPVRGDLRGRYEPADGSAAIHASDEVRLVQLGRRGAVSGPVAKP